MTLMVFTDGVTSLQQVWIRKRRKRLRSGWNHDTNPTTRAHYETITKAHLTALSGWQINDRLVIEGIVGHELHSSRMLWSCPQPLFMTTSTTYSEPAIVVNIYLTADECFVSIHISPFAVLPAQWMDLRNMQGLVPVGSKQLIHNSFHPRTKPQSILDRPEYQEDMPARLETVFKTASQWGSYCCDNVGVVIPTQHTQKCYI